MPQPWEDSELRYHQQRHHQQQSGQLTAQLSLQQQLVERDRFRHQSQQQQERERLLQQGELRRQPLAPRTLSAPRTLAAPLAAPLSAWRAESLSPRLLQQAGGLPPPTTSVPWTGPSPLHERRRGPLGAGGAADAARAVAAPYSALSEAAADAARTVAASSGPPSSAGRRGSRRASEEPAAGSCSQGLLVRCVLIFSLVTNVMLFIAWRSDVGLGDWSASGVAGSGGPAAGLTGRAGALPPAAALPGAVAGLSGRAGASPPGAAPPGVAAGRAGRAGGRTGAAPVAPPPSAAANVEGSGRGRGTLEKAAAVRDTDGDGIPDHHDFCPGSTAEGHGGWMSGRATDFDGDGCKDGDQDKDTDNDGVPDAHDGCPFTPQSYRFVSNPVTDFDGDGCADGLEDGDDDDDGLANQVDDCPRTDPTDAGQPDARGCSQWQRDIVTAALEAQVAAAAVVAAAAPAAESNGWSNMIVGNWMEVCFAAVLTWLMRQVQQAVEKVQQHVPASPGASVRRLSTQAIQVGRRSWRVSWPVLQSVLVKAVGSFVFFVIVYKHRKK